MTTPRLVSLTALAASLFIVIITVTQANSRTGFTGPQASASACSGGTETHPCVEHAWQAALR
ncbi:hypothetical protein [Pelagibacterium lacus]|uniref:Uncharacterized protein n=1 Tax=Pelagibacterium lacus TaxID=2282655 RepID=A0A369W207_9HYPH|nr:hypothetical protein [Pelagibacterium lacus]RDE08716.1 hypothetical protein DVH29_09745 [Pelagibacterium lacus]